MMEIKGLDELIEGIDPSERLKITSKMVKHHGAELHRTMVRNAKFIKGYSVGTTKKSIKLESVDNLTIRVAPHTHYSAYLELGTRFMSAQPFVKPSLEQIKPKFLDDLSRLEKIK